MYLSGNVKINTIFGSMPIRYLSGHYERVIVYTYDQINREVIKSEATNIKLSGKNQKTIRIDFENDQIDCTAEQKFLVFSDGVLIPVVAKSLVIGTKMLGFECIKTVKSISSLNSDDTYSLETTNNWIFANNILVKTYE